MFVAEPGYLSRGRRGQLETRPRANRTGTAWRTILVPRIWRPLRKPTSTTSTRSSPIRPCGPTQTATPKTTSTTPSHKSHVDCTNAEQSEDVRHAHVTRRRRRLTIWPRRTAWPPAGIWRANKEVQLKELVLERQHDRAHGHKFDEYATDSAAEARPDCAERAAPDKL